MIGRHPELTEIVRLVAGSRRGSLHIGVVTGEAGIGKTRMLAEAAAVAGTSGIEVVRTSAEPFDRTSALAVVRQFANTFVEHPVPTIAALARELEAPAGSFGGEGSSLVTSTLERLLRAVTDRSPLLWLIDDLHDADDDSVHQLGAVLRQLGRTRLTVVLALRDTKPELTPDLELLVDTVTAWRNSSHVRLEPLGPEAVSEICEHHLGGGASAEVAATVWDACQGNPFFAEEAIRLISNTGRAAGVASPSRAGVALHRVFRLGHAARMMSRAASVWGAVHLDDLDDLGLLAGLSTTDATEGFDVLVTSGVLRTDGDGRYVFTHPIIRDAVYADLGPAKRRRLHADVIARLRARGTDDAMVLAPHVEQSARRGDTTAVETLVAAANEASGVAPRNAIWWLRSALALTGGDDDTDGPVHALLARCLQRIGADEEAVRHGQIALDLLPPSADRDRAIGVHMFALETLGRFPDALEVSERIGPADEHEPPRLMAQRAMLLVHQVQLADAEALARRALDEAGDDDGAAALAWSAIGALEYSRGQLGTAIEAFARQEALARHLPVTARLRASVLSASYLAYAGQLGVAAVAVEEARKLVATTGLVGMQAQLDLADLVIDWHAGRWPEALAAARSLADRLGSEGRWFLVGFTEAIETAILAATTSPAVPAEPPSRSPGRHMVATGFSAWAYAQWLDAAGRPDDAGRVLEASLEDDLRLGRRNMLTMYVAALASHPARRQLASEWLERIDVTSIDAGPWAGAERLRACAIIADDPDGARQAATVADDAGLRYPAAMCELTRARLGDVDVDRLRDAHRSFTGLGAQRAAAEAARLLRSAGAHPARRPPAGAVSQTEWDLAELVAAGYSNPEIAEKLFLSRKTVETYLSRLYTKVGCRNRVDLARAIATGALSPG